MPNAKRVMNERLTAEVPISFEVQMTVRGGSHKQATVLPLGCCNTRRDGVPLHTCLAENAVVVRDGVWRSSMVVAVERGLYGPQA